MRKMSSQTSMSDQQRRGHRLFRPQNALRVIGAGLVLQGLLFFAFAVPLTQQIFPAANDQAIHVGMVMRRGLATMSFLAGLVIFLVRDESDRVTKRVLFGCCIGFAAISLSMLKLILDAAAVIPLPAMIIYSAATLISGYLAFEKTA